MSVDRKPALWADISPYFKEYVQRRIAKEWEENGRFYQCAILPLLGKGGKAGRQHASDGLIMWEHRRPCTAGRMMESRVSWGDRYPRIDDTAQELNIGALHFLCADICFATALSTAMRTSLGAPGKVELGE